MGKKMKRNPYFKNNIRLLRLQYDMSQEEFAIALGMEPGKSTNLSARISGWERGEREPSLEGLSDICRRFGVTADWLLGIDNSVVEMENYGYDRLTKQKRRQLIKIIKVFLEDEDDEEDFEFGEQNAAPIN